MSRARWCGLVAGVLVLAACGGGSSSGSPTTAATATAATVATTIAATTTAPTTVAATAAPTTAPPTTVATTPPAPQPCAVALLADSVGYDLFRNGLESSLASVACPIRWSRAQRGLAFAEGVAALEQAGATDTDVVLIVQGYAKARASEASFPTLIDDVVSAAGDRLVIWPLYGRTADCSALYSDTLAEYNQRLQEATQRWPNLRLVDYPAHIAAHPEYGAGRCPHLLDPGSKAVSEWLAGEVRRIADTAPAPS